MSDPRKISEISPYEMEHLYSVPLQSPVDPPKVLTEQEYRARVLARLAPAYAAKQEAIRHWKDVLTGARRRELTYSEIARAVGLSEAAIRNQCKRWGIK